VSASKAQRAKTAQRRTQAIGLALAGLSWDAIADKLGYSSRQAAHKDVQRALAQAVAEQTSAAEELRMVELMRLDRLQAAAWPKALTGDLKAIETCLKIITERRKLLGLDAPAKLEVITLDAVDAEIRRLEAELAALPGGAEAGETAPAEDASG
jgi:hypothetical protein